MPIDGDAVLHLTQAPEERPEAGIALIRRLLTEIAAHESGALERAIELGRYLMAIDTTAARDQQVAEAGMSVRTAQDYERLARHESVIRRSGAASIRAALAVLPKVDRGRQPKTVTGGGSFNVDFVRPPEVLALLTPLLEARTGHAATVSVTWLERVNDPAQPFLPGCDD